MGNPSEYNEGAGIVKAEPFDHSASNPKIGERKRMRTVYEGKVSVRLMGVPRTKFSIRGELFFAGIAYL